MNARTWLAAGLVLVLAGETLAAPTISNVTPRHLLVGGTTTVTIDGGDLAGNPRLFLPGAKATVKPGATPQRVQFDVEVPADDSAMIASLRIATDTGISPSVPVCVDRVPSQPFAETAAKLPVALLGDLTGQTTLRTKFAGRKGQPLVVEILARRLGGNLNPVLHLNNSRGVQIAWANEHPLLAGDARLAAVLPEDGEYTVELHDAFYRGAGPGHFRLAIGELTYADVAFSLGGKPTQGMQTMGFASTNIPQREGSVLVQEDHLPGVRRGRLPHGALGVGTGPQWIVSGFPEVADVAATSPASPPRQLPPAPVAVMGRLATPRTEQKFSLDVKPGAKLKFDLLAQRVGLPLDGVLTIRDEKGKQLASADDRPGTTDPGLDFTVPGGVKKIIIAVKDLAGRGGDQFVYHLAIEPAEQPDFALTIEPNTIVVPRGGRTFVKVNAKRDNYSNSNPIVLAAQNLPPGLEFHGHIQIDAKQGLAVLSSTGPSPAAAVVSLVGRGGNEQTPILRAVPTNDRAEIRGRPWSRDEIGVATGTPSPLTVDWSSPREVYSTQQGGKYPLAVKITRGDKVTGSVRLSLVTTQEIPTKTVNNQQVPDTEKTLRLEANPTLPPTAAEATVTLVVPPKLPPMIFDFVLQAELLSPDGKQPLATTCTLPQGGVIFVVVDTKPIVPKSPPPEPKTPPKP